MGVWFLTRILLDTNVLIGDPPFLRHDDELAISSVTYAELEAGTRMARSDVEAATRVRLLAAVRATYGAGLPFDDRVAASFGLLSDLVSRSGRTVRSRIAGLMIAATAHAHGAVLLTYKVGDFTGLEDAVSVLDGMTTR